MFLRSTARKKNGKEHTYWSLVENKRVAGDRVVQRHVLYLGEINDWQQEAWRRTIEVFEEGEVRPKTVALFPEDRAPAVNDEQVVQIRLKDLELHRPRQWGGCWLACQLYQELGLDKFWEARLPANRKGTRWDLILQILACYGLLEPGSEWRLHRHWFEQSAMGDLLGKDFSLAEIHKLYSCLDQILVHKKELFSHLQNRWKDLFNANFEVLLYDLTSTYFESDPPFSAGDKRRYGYSRDKRSDCVQVVIALVITPEGFPLSYEVLAGNTADNTTLKSFLHQIQEQYGKAQRIWVMDRGIPTEEVLEQMRTSQPPVSYLVGTPKARLNKLEQALTQLPWQKVREGVEVKLLPQEEELYVFAQSQDRVHKERSMRRRQLKRLWARLKELQGMKLNSKQLLLKLGAAQNEYPAAWRLIDIDYPSGDDGAFAFRLNTPRLRQVYRREGRYLLRSNLKSEDPAKLWKIYVQLTQIEEAFRNLKGDLAIRPIYHQKIERIEAHIFVCFLAYCLHVTLRHRLQALAPGLTSRSILEKFQTIQMIDVHLPTTDGREVILSRYTQPTPEIKMVLEKLKLKLPAQPPPQITSRGLAMPV